jgi:hypothetical protein
MSDAFSVCAHLSRIGEAFFKNEVSCQVLLSVCLKSLAVCLAVRFKMFSHFHVF